MTGVAEQITNLNERLTVVETMAQVELTNWRVEVDKAIQEITSLESTSLQQLCISQYSQGRIRITGSKNTGIGNCEQTKTRLSIQERNSGEPSHTADGKTV